MLSDVTTQPLTPESLDPDPLRQFERWLRDATDRAGLTYPNAVCLSTVDPSGWPEGRIVLLKGVEDGGFVFFTNRRSAKGRALVASPRAALTFYWEALGRQVRAQGRVLQVDDGASDRYFAGRPRGSQLGAWASAQSEVLPDRRQLEQRFQELQASFDQGPVPRPPHWGGYRVIPRMVEFWQEGGNRLHDRFRYRRETDAASWRVERLSP